MKKKLFYFTLLLLFTSCARTYHVIEPSLYNYENKKTLTDEVSISYYYNVQHQGNNKPYARKERKKHKRLVAIKMVNNSDSVITLSQENFYIKTSSGRDIRIIDDVTYTKAIRQYSETFVLFYGLAGISYRWESVNGQVSTELTYNPIPLIIGIGNAIYAEISNSKQKQNLANNQIFNKPIHPKSSLYGLIAIEEAGYPELNFFYYNE